MEISSVLRAQSVRTTKPRAFDAVSAFELVDAVKDRYNFRQVPTTQEINAGSPTNFVFGKMREGDREVTIESFSIVYYGTFATGITAVTRSSTDDADLFLDDLRQWAVDKYKFDATPIIPANYHSQLEVIFNKTLDKRFEGLKQFGVTVADFLRGYGFNKYPDFEPIGFSMHFDGTKPDRYAAAFSLERRGGASYESNKYFAQAPLKTDHHIEVLRQIEEWL